MKKLFMSSRVALFCNVSPETFLNVDTPATVLEFSYPTFAIFFCPLLSSFIFYVSDFFLLFRQHVLLSLFDYKNCELSCTLRLLPQKNIATPFSA